MYLYFNKMDFNYIFLAWLQYLYCVISGQSIFWYFKVVIIPSQYKNGRIPTREMSTEAHFKTGTQNIKYLYLKVYLKKYTPINSFYWGISDD